MDSEPTAIEFRWSFNSTPGISRDLTRHSKEENGTSVLTYVPHEAADYGTLQCWGRNEIGWQRISCTYHIVPAGKPDPPQNCISTNVTHHSIVVKCQKGFDGGKFQSFWEIVKSCSINISRVANTFISSAVMRTGINPRQFSILINHYEYIWNIQRWWQ